MKIWKTKERKVWRCRTCICALFLLCTVIGVGSKKVWAFADIPDAIKEPRLLISDDDEELVEENKINSREDTFSYTLSFTVPENENDFSDLKANIWADKCLYMKSAEVSSNTGKDISKYFDINTEENGVSIKTKNSAQEEILGRTCHFTIYVAFDPDQPIEHGWKEDHYEFGAHGEVILNRQSEEQVEMTKEVKTVLQAEYEKGIARVMLKDAVTSKPVEGAIFTVYIWSKEKENYEEVGRMPYSQEDGYYEFGNLNKTEANQGKYRVVQTETAPWYSGQFIQNFEITKNQEVCAFEAENQPSGKENLRMETAIVKEDNTQTDQQGSTEEPTTVLRGERIVYHLYVDRECAKGYKSEELLLTSKIPEGAVYDKKSLNLLGEILNRTEDSVAKIKSVRVDDGTITWKITGLDQGESAHVIYEIQMPDTPQLLATMGKLTGSAGEEVTSNTVTHRLLAPVLSVEKSADPPSGTSLSEGDIITYYIKATNTGDADAGQIILREYIPAGTVYVADTLTCGAPDSTLHLATQDENGEPICKMVYSVLPKLGPGQTAIMSFQVKISPDAAGGQIVADAQLAELLSPDETAESVAVGSDNGEAYQNSNAISHPIVKNNEVIPAQEANDQKGDGATQQYENQNRNSENNQQGETTVAKRTISAKTGDPACLWWYGAMGLASVITALVTFRRISYNKRQKKS